MALATERISERSALLFPKLGLVPSEMDLVVVTNLFVRSLAKATRKDSIWERDFVGQVNLTLSAYPFSESLYDSLEYLVQTVIHSEPFTDLGRSRRSQVEGNLSATKAMETTVRSLDLLLQLKLGIKSTQAIKREAKLKTAKQADRLKAGGAKIKGRTVRALYEKEVRVLKSLNNDHALEKGPVGIYNGWKTQLLKKTESTHQAYLRYRKELGYL